MYGRVVVEGVHYTPYVRGAQLYVELKVRWMRDVSSGAADR